MLIVFVKILGLASVGWGLTIWWWMVIGVLDGRVEATTKAGELWFSQLHSPLAFRVTLAIYFVVGLGFIWLGISLLREKNHPR